MSKKKNGNGNGNGNKHPIVDNNNNYPEYARAEIRKKKKIEDTYKNRVIEPIITKIPRSWLVSLSLLFFYTGFSTVTITCYLFSL